MTGAAKSVANTQQQHDNPKGEAAESQAAAVSPAAELAGQAQSGQVGQMEQAETPEFDKEKFKQALKAKIEATLPKNAEEADNAKNDNRMGSVKSEVKGTVDQETAQSRQPLDQARQAGPDQGAVETRQPDPLKASPPGAAPTEIGAEAAVPKPKGQGELETPLTEGSQAIDQQMADAEISDETLANSNEPEFASALEEKKKAKESVAAAPAAYRATEAGMLSSAEGDAVTAAQAGLQGMHAERSALLSQADGKQTETKSADEQKRAEVGAEINAIYSETQTKVEEILAGLDAEVEQVFDAGAQTAKVNFENYLESEIDAYKEDRYGGMFGWARWVADKFKMPSGIQKILDKARAAYIKEMDGIIDQVASIISSTLTRAKAEVAKGKERIQTYVSSLPEDLQQIGQEAAANIEDKFSQLESQISDKQGELVDTLAKKYQENMAAVDAKLEETRQANSGLIDMAIDKIGGVIQTIIRLKNMLLDVLARAAAAVKAILKDPIGFLGNLIEGVKAGFDQFISNIGTHLKTGLITWLTGNLAGAGITIPKDFSLQSIFQLVLDILGISFEKIMGKLGNALGVDILGIFDQVKGLVEIYDSEGLAGLAQFGLEKVIGAENMDHLMEVWNIFQRVKEGGIGAIWELVSEHLSDLKEMVMGKISEFISEKVFKAGITWIISLFNPAGAFIKACKGIYDIVMFFVNKGSQIMALVNAVIGSISSIASGNLGAAANFIEQTLAKAIPVAIGFLSSLLGLGDVSEKVREIIINIRSKIDMALDKLFQSKPVQAVAGFIKKIAGKIKNFGAAVMDRAGEMVGFNSESEKDARSLEQKEIDLDKGVSEATDLLIQSDISPTSQEMDSKVSIIKEKYGMKELTLVQDNQSNGWVDYYFEGEVNPRKNGKHIKKRGDHIFANGLHQTINDIIEKISDEFRRHSRRESGS